MNWIPIRSTFIRAFHYDASTQTLVVEMKRGDFHAYAPVPQEVVDEFEMAAHDGGGFFNERIRKSFAEVPLPGKQPEA